MDAKLCPDGSSVGRTGPNCEFSECPTTKTYYPKVVAPENWLSVESKKSLFKVWYPKDLELKHIITSQGEESLSFYDKSKEVAGFNEPTVVFVINQGSLGSKTLGLFASEEATSLSKSQNFEIKAEQVEYGGKSGYQLEAAGENIIYFEMTNGKYLKIIVSGNSGNLNGKMLEVFQLGS